MKVTRLRKGYRITLSDSEFGALNLLLDEGKALIENVEGGTMAVSRAVNRALRGRFSNIDAMKIDDDRRGE